VIFLAYRLLAERGYEGQRIAVSHATVRRAGPSTPSALALGCLPYAASDDLA
jgi:hypothetical protein